LKLLALELLFRLGLDDTLHPQRVVFKHNPRRVDFARGRHLKAGANQFLAALDERYS
jgi:hypothetical protein